MRRSWPHRGDVAVALGLLLVIQLPWLDPFRDSSGPWWAFPAIPGVAALAWRRSHPRTVWALATVTAVPLLALRSGGGAWGALGPLLLMIAPLLALATAVQLAPRRRGLVGLSITAAALELGLLWHSTRLDTLVLAALAAVAAWALGDSARTRRAYTAALAERTAADERARLSRELHDQVARNLGAVALQAGTARMLAEAGEAPEAELLADLEEVSRQVMDDLRQAVGAPGDGMASGLHKLPGLIDRIAPTGLTVTVAGLPGDLPEHLDLAAYRVIQEGLTNVLRHSAARRARVELRRSPDAITVSVLDDGPLRLDASPSATHPGQGLLALRERASALGGWLRAGPRPTGGYELRAHLPLEPPEPSPLPEAIKTLY